MPTTVWLALICLIFLGGILLRSNIGARPMDRETAAVLDAAPDFPIDDRPPLAKSDRMPSPYLDGSAAKPAGTVLPASPDPVIAPKVNQAGSLPSQSTADTSEATTWHWHVGSKITKRTTVAPRDSRKAD
jgi:hypothetical protein